MSVGGGCVFSCTTKGLMAQLLWERSERDSYVIPDEMRRSLTIISLLQSTVLLVTHGKAPSQLSSQYNTLGDSMRHNSWLYTN